MARAVIASLVITAAILAPATAQQIDDRLLSDLRKSVVAFPGLPSEAAQLYRKAIQSTDRSAWAKLAGDQSASVALQVFWDIKLKRGKPADKKKITESHYPDPSFVSDFVKEVTDKVGVAPPKWWQQSLAQTRIGRERLHVMEVVKDDKRVRGTVVQSKQQVTITSGKESYTIQREKLDPIISLVGADANAACLLNLKDPVIVLTSENGLPFSVFSVQRSSGELKWHNQVWAIKGFGGTGGATPHEVEAIHHKGNLIIFGCEAFGIYVEMFAIDDGKCLLRFCSSYWSFYP